eukprot:CAMPEP_0205907554 /NCGR_PEP_ID=MMETSP1325-20131115/2631_1 /ASSEMBLY_ACC=CAM_ASM_000708 /TAXON_ID=236786 /ORGANISM="Florenciella sp., Strain RCC1007" /LENGTH=187 /DNA_ID=CAMNT_0053273659 /DNA_START=186 /DNA_END=750 /DNA_ORIENTATION=+
MADGLSAGAPAEGKTDEMAVDAPAAPAPAAAAAAASGDGVRFEIRKWNAVCMWSWDICADTCAICRNSLNEPSIEYQANPSPNNETAFRSRSAAAVTSSTSTVSRGGSKLVRCVLSVTRSGSSPKSSESRDIPSQPPSTGPPGQTPDGTRGVDDAGRRAVGWERPEIPTTACVPCEVRCEKRMWLGT